MEDSLVSPSTEIGRAGAIVGEERVVVGADLQGRMTGTMGMMMIDGNGSVFLLRQIVSICEPLLVFLFGLAEEGREGATY